MSEEVENVTSEESFVGKWLAGESAEPDAPETEEQAPAEEEVEEAEEAEEAEAAEEDPESDEDEEADEADETPEDETSETPSAPAPEKDDKWDKAIQKMDQLAATLERQQQAAQETPGDDKLQRKVEKTKTRIRELLESEEFPDTGQSLKATEETIEQIRKELRDEIESEYRPVKQWMEVEQAERRAEQDFNKNYPELRGQYREVSEAAIARTNAHKRFDQMDDATRASYDLDHIEAIAAERLNSKKAKDIPVPKPKPKPKPKNTNPVKAKVAAKPDAEESADEKVAKWLGL